MIESELRYFVLDLDNVRRVLMNSGALFLRKREVRDIYFGSGKMDDAVIRVRVKDGKVKMHLKGSVKRDKGVFTRLETSLIAEDANLDEIIEILRELGLKKISENRSVKEYWELGDIEVSISDLYYPAKLTYIEFEGRNLDDKVVSKKLKPIFRFVRPIKEEDFKVFDEVNKNEDRI